MGWISSDHEHEGWVAVVALDGRLSGISSAAGMHVQGVTGHRPQDPQLDDYEIPDQEIIVLDRDIVQTLTDIEKRYQDSSRSLKLSEWKTDHSTRSASTTPGASPQPCNNRT